MSDSSRKPSAIIAHPLWGRGGAESAAMWIIKALLRDFDITVYTRGGFDLGELNRLAELDVAPTQIDLRIADSANAWPLGALGHGAFLRSLRKVGDSHDLRVTASGVLHWGRPALHFLSSAIWNDALADRFNAPGAPRRRSMAQTAAWRLSAEISAQRGRSLEADLFVANSDWTARQSQPYCPGLMDVIPPAAPLGPPGPGWDERETGVLVFGRVSPEKRIEACVEIVEGLRTAGFPLALCIAGPDSESGYGARIDALCRARSAWVERIPLVTGAAKRRLLGRFRYGLSACEIEAFGIAPAEMAANGMVALAPVNGAQREILRDPMQIYGSVEDAVDRFARIFSDAAEQRRLHQLALETRGRYAPERFVKKVRAVARRFVDDSCDNATRLTREPA